MKSASKIGSSTSFTADCTTWSRCSGSPAARSSHRPGYRLLPRRLRTNSRSSDPAEDRRAGPPAGPAPTARGATPSIPVVRPLRPVTGLSASDETGPPSHPGRVSRRRAFPRPAGSGPARTAGMVSNVHSRTDRRDRRPGMPLQHRRGYAAHLHRGLPDRRHEPAPELPTGAAPAGSGRPRPLRRPGGEGLPPPLGSASASWRSRSQAHSWFGRSARN